MSAEFTLTQEEQFEALDSVNMSRESISASGPSVGSPARLDVDGPGLSKHVTLSGTSAGRVNLVP